MGDIYRSAEKVWVYLGSCAGGEEENCRKHERFTDRIGAAFDAAIDFCLDQKGELSQNRQRYDYWWKRVWTMYVYVQQLRKIRSKWWQARGSPCG